MVPDCYQLNVVASPGDGTAVAVDCKGNDRYSSSGFFTFDLYGKGVYCFDCQAATEPSTWGSVKALYR